MSIRILIFVNFGVFAFLKLMFDSVLLDDDWNILFVIVLSDNFFNFLILVSLYQISRYVRNEEVYHDGLNNPDYARNYENYAPVMRNFLYIQNNSDSKTNHDANDSAHTEKRAKQRSQ